MFSNLDMVSWKEGKALEFPSITVLTQALTFWTHVTPSIQVLMRDIY